MFRVHLLIDCINESTPYRGAYIMMFPEETFHKTR